MNRRKAIVRISIPTCIFVAMAWLPLASAGDWPGFRGPHGDGVAENEKPPVCFSESSNLLWKAELPAGLSSPVIWKDQVFVTGAKPGDKMLITLCLDATTGKQQWENALAVEKMEPVHKVNTQATSTPVTDGKAVYAYFGSFGLVAYDLAGKELWRKPLPMPKTFMNQGTGTSPILVDNKLLVFVQKGSESHILAVDPGHGHELWKASMPQYNNSYGTPAAWKENGKSFVGLTCAMRFTAFDAAEGKEAWWVEGVGFQACGTPIVAGDRLIVSAAGALGEPSNTTPPPRFDDFVKQYDKDGDGAITLDEIPADLLYANRQSPDGKGNMPLRQALSMFGGVKKGDKLDREKWEGIRTSLASFGSSEMNRPAVLLVRTGGTEDVSKSHVVWKENKGVPEVPSPLAWKDRVYMIRSGGLLVCRDLESGKQVYEERVDAPGAYFASPIAADGRIYVASDQGEVTVIKAGDSMQVLAHNKLGESILASPAVAANTLFIRTVKGIWAFKEKAANRKG
jgi:outer membrane protein assembly factor BamB